MMRLESYQEAGKPQRREARESRNLAQIQVWVHDGYSSITAFVVAAEGDPTVVEGVKDGWEDLNGMTIMPFSGKQVPALSAW